MTGRREPVFEPATGEQTHEVDVADGTQPSTGIVDLGFPGAR